MALVNLLRHDLRLWEARQGQPGFEDEPRPRVVVFMENDTAVFKAAPALRNTLWGEHKIYALLPDEGNMPLQVLEQFAGAASASVEARSKVLQSKPLGSSGGPGFDLWSVTTAPTVRLTVDRAGGKAWQSRRPRVGLGLQDRR